MPRSLFIEGPAGVGKTTHAIRAIRSLLDQGVPPESILVLVAHPALGQPYQMAFSAPDWPSGAQPTVTTLGGLAQRGLAAFWPVVAKQAGFARPELEPVFLNLETAQYYMYNFVKEAVSTGVFDSVSVTRPRIISQTLDNLSKAAVNGFSLDEVAQRLITAWGDRHSSRPPVYHASLALAQRFRDHCLQHSLVDFSLQIELFSRYLLHEPLYREWFTERYRHLIADNLEENIPIAADFLRWLWDSLDTALLLYDTDAGYRVFLGADPAGMHTLSALCDKVERWTEPHDIAPSMIALARELNSLLGGEQSSSAPPDANPREAFVYESHKFYPQMVNWVVDRIADLVDQGVPPCEMVVLAPFLGDSLRFTLMTQLHARGIPAVSHRPSRALREEPAARAILTLMAVAHPDWPYRPPVADFADALHQVIDGLDPVRAWLLAQIVYKPHRRDLGSFDFIQAGTQARITYVVGEKYEHLRRWLAAYEMELGTVPPDHFISRLFGELLSQPGFGFHTNLDAGRVAAELVESARRFRQTLYPDGAENWAEVAYDYFSLVREGMLAALYVASWRDEEKNAVFLAPAYTFLMRNRRVDYQFWLDVGSAHWWERLEQPLTHPYVLSRGYPADQVWTDDLEYQSRRDTLRRLILGLTYRCRKNVYVAISNLGEQGYEQRGPLLQVLQRVIQRYDLAGETT